MPIALLKEYDAELRTAFRLQGVKCGKHFASKTAALHLLRDPFTINIELVLNDLLTKFDTRQQCYWDTHGVQPAGRSNWTLRRVEEISEDNTSPEVILERRIVRILGNDWSNMIPVASGTYSRMGLGRASIDLAKVDGDTVEFIELKIGSDNPFHAAMELAAYALMWIQARADAEGPNHFGYRAGGELRPALAYDRLRWTVLAPQATGDSKNFYEGYSISSFADALGKGLNAASYNRLRNGVEMSFGFKAFDYERLLPSDEVLREIIDLRS
jgi:hypothetical protein